jgi:uncharacterized repeat protein (TIGR01451 family)
MRSLKEAGRRLGFRGVVVGAAAAGTLTTAALAAAPGALAQTAPAPPSPAAPTVAVAPNRADLSVKVSGPATAPTGSTVTYTVTVTNRGPATATNVRTAVTLSPGLSPAQQTEASAAGASGPTASTVVNFGPGASETFQVPATVTAPSGRHVLALATTRSSVPDPNPLNNISAAITTVTRSAAAR